MNIDTNTLVVLNLGTLVAFISIYSRLVYRYAKLELTVEFMQKDLNAAWARIKEK